MLFQSDTIKIKRSFRSIMSHRRMSYKPKDKVKVMSDMNSVTSSVWKRGVSFSNHSARTQAHTAVAAVSALSPGVPGSQYSEAGFCVGTSGCCHRCGQARERLFAHLPHPQELTQLLPPGRQSPASRSLPQHALLQLHVQCCHLLTGM